MLLVSAVFVNNPMPEPASLTASAGGFALTLQIVAGVTSFHNAWPGGAVGEAMQKLRQKTTLPLSQDVTAGRGTQFAVRMQSSAKNCNR